MVTFDVTATVDEDSREDAKNEFIRMCGVEFPVADNAADLDAIEQKEDGGYVATGSITISATSFLYQVEDAGDFLNENVPDGAGVDFIAAKQTGIRIRGDLEFDTQGRDEHEPEDADGYYAVPDEVRNEASERLESYFGQPMPIDDIGKYGNKFVASYSGELYQSSEVVGRAVKQAKSAYTPSQEWDSFEPQ